MIKASLLELLRRQGGQWLGVEALGIALGVSPAEIHRMVEQVRQLGHEIEAHPVNGFCLV
ncbi:MAG: HTH domain-containing protein, partial [Planctomycetes bacterium]|nr:HTH domain-containing protein [Planctomycetota bacterium]